MENSFSNSNQSSNRGVGFAFILAVALGLCVITDLRAQVIVVPNAMATNDGDTFLNASDGLGGAIRIMLIFDASQFGALSGPSFLTQFVLRPDASPGPSGPKIQTFRLYASTTSRSVAEMSTTFADNLGTNPTLVFDGTVPWTTGNLPGPGDTGQFDIVTPFTTPYLYNPANGNLLLELQTISGSGPGITWDAVTDDPFVRTVLAPGSSTAETGNFIPSGVTQFAFQSPPLVTIRTSQVEVCWNSKSNQTYQVQYRSGLTTNLWTSLGDCIRSTNSTSCVYDPIVVGQPQRFYRVVLTNCVP